MARARKPQQLALPLRTWGGARKGAGRPPAGAKAGVSHLRRARLVGRHPVHVTMRVRSGVPNLRGRRVYPSIVEAIAAGRERFGGRVVHFSVQSNHVHLLVEAADGRALSRLLQGLSIRIARAVNARADRRGKVFADRFHAHTLETPLEVRRALAYVLGNQQKHAAERGVLLSGVMDVCSSAPWFDGWSIPDAAERALGLPRAAPDATCPVAPARTWLLSVGYRRHGALDPDGVSGGRQRRSR